jgi:hypothetical protein
MPKLKKNSLKLDMPAAVQRNARGLILLLVGVIFGTSIVVGQQGAPMTKKQIPVFDRFENAIKAKEPGFKLTGKLVRDNQQEKYVLLGWQSGEDLVSTNTYELASPQDAEEMLRKSLVAPRSVPVQTIKLTQLGDEAYMSTGLYAKEGKTNLLLRKRNYFIMMTASSQSLAKRFAKHMAMEIDN